MFGRDVNGAVSNDPRFQPVTMERLVSRGSNGNPVRDTNGNPVYQNYIMRHTLTMLRERTPEYVDRRSPMETTPMDEYPVGSDLRVEDPDLMRRLLTPVIDQHFVDAVRAWNTWHPAPLTDEQEENHAPFVYGGVTYI